MPMDDDMMQDDLQNDNPTPPDADDEDESMEEGETEDTEEGEMDDEEESENEE